VCARVPEREREREREGERERERESEQYSDPVKFCAVQYAAMKSETGGHFEGDRESRNECKNEIARGGGEGGVMRDRQRAV